MIYRYVEEPFTSSSPEALFCAAQFLFNNMPSDPPQSVSKAAILYALARQAKVSMTSPFP